MFHLMALSILFIWWHVHVSHTGVSLLLPLLSHCLLYFSLSIQWFDFNFWETLSSIVYSIFFLLNLCNLFSKLEQVYQRKMSWPINNSDLDILNKWNIGLIFTSCKWRKISNNMSGSILVTCEFNRFFEDSRSV
jgi:hypothetical protein